MDGLLNNLLPEVQGSCENCLPRLPEMQIKKGGSIIETSLCLFAVVM